MKIFFISDIIGKPGRQIIQKELIAYRHLESPDLVIANAENAADGKGLTPLVANELFLAGVDLITLGNHTWAKKEIKQIISDKRVIRPLNYPPNTPGQGYGLAITKRGLHIAVINLIGRVFMQALDCPFHAIDRILPEIKEDIVIVDVHAEATSEKMALAWYLDGRVSAVIGTHTHVQTADEKILPRGTAYITDAGMTGPADSVLGVKKEIIIEKFLTQLPKKHEIANTKVVLEGVIVEIDDVTYKAKSIKRVQLGDGFKNDC
ncbi:MAG: TIGR00282 family metallophosphoesterase [bacterium]|nr:TIGR00282 family metallophosphoesterase [bacterium]